ncbi:MAG TPA: DUF1566 domain-containing protein, partial [bacterium]|nr:DUF1566 domain-containing protein [bacterium]
MRKVLLFVWAVFLIVSCDAIKLTERGGEGEACYLDNTCKEPFECVDGTCVKKTADTDDIAETDDELVVGDEDEDGEKDEKDISDAKDGDEGEGEDDAVGDDVADDDTTDDDTTDNLSDVTDASDEIVTDDAVIVADEDSDDDQPDPTDSSDEPVGDDTVVVTDDDVVVTANVLCTGQTKCYDATAEMTCPTEGNDFYGQDAQYAVLGFCTPRDYTVSGTSGNDVVTDNVTGLIWQRTLPATYAGCTGESGTKCTWQEAVDYCANLSYGGSDDWRLPTRKELATLADYGKNNPAIDTAMFPGTQSNYYWSSSPYVNNTSFAWVVYFIYSTIGADDKMNPNYARCVRGATLPDSVFTEATVAGKVMVTDTTSALIWTKEYSASTLTWKSALDYCETLDYGDATDWRLPNIEELKTLIDDTRYNPASSFPGGIPTNWFWSSSSYMSSTTYAWSVNSGSGNVSSNNKTDNYYARCVRSEPIAPVDECITQSNPCDEGGDANAICDDEAVGYTCNCSLNYTDDGTTCAPDTRTFYCAAKPVNADWNTVDSYEQTWDGAAWVPDDSVTAYNATASTTACRFKCAAGYYWNGDSCINERIVPCNGIIANAIYYGGETTYSITQTYTIADGWGPDTDAFYADGIADEGTCEYQCNTNYSWTGEECLADMRTFTCDAKPAHTDWNTVSSYQQTWIDGNTWDPADDPDTDYNPTGDTASCRYKCVAGYYWNGSYCVNDKVTCTGQSKCYDNSAEMTCPPWNSAFFGQDYQYSWGQCNARSYTVSGTAPNDVVVDNNTGLIWQRTLPATYAGCTGGAPTGSTCMWQEAVDYCENLTYGGQDDWRLPSRKELATLPDYGYSNPAIDTTTFPDTQSGFYWASTPYVNDAAQS